ncbi:MAG: lysylphosphatidylglycerol synthase transmembrane domain-containing protein [Chloroflexota bacterium]
MNIRRIGLGIIVSGICLYFVVRGVEWSEVLRHLSEVNLALFSLSMLLMLLAYFLMTWRWQHLLDPLELPAQAGGTEPVASKSAPASRGGIFGLYAKVMTGYFFNAFFPARAGDIVRAYLLGRETGLRKTTILATIVIEKSFDGIALLLMLLLSLVLLPSATSTASGVNPDLLAGVAGVGLVAAVAGLVLFYRYSDRIARLVERLFAVLPLPRRLEKLIVRLIETFASGMHVFKTPRPLIFAASISLLVWVVVAFMFVTALLSFQSPFPPELLAPAGILFMTALVNLGLLVPALPGNVGTYEALCVAAMAVFNVDKELAVAFALIFHVGQLVVTLVIGAVAFWTQNLSLSEIRPVEQRAGEEAEQSLEKIGKAAEQGLAAARASEASSRQADKR